jgi:hypothetical protein
MDPVAEYCILAHINPIANEGMVADGRPSVDPAACTHPATAPDPGACLNVGGCADEGRAVYFCARRNKASAIGMPLVPGDLAGVVFHEFDFPAHTSDPRVPVQLGGPYRSTEGPATRINAQESASIPTLLWQRPRPPPRITLDARRKGTLGHVPIGALT